MKFNISNMTVALAAAALGAASCTANYEDINRNPYEVTAEDMESFAISVSLMNVKAYGIAVIKPAQDSEDTVKEGLQGFIDQQQQNFQMYLPDQYEVAKNARLETLEDGTVVMVMCEDQDTVFDSIIDSLQAG